MSRWFLTFAVLGWSLLQADAIAFDDAAALCPEPEPTTISGPGDPADDSPDGLPPPAAATVPDTSAGAAPAGRTRVAVAVPPDTDHPARAPPRTDSA
jgi:hypothetical protein